jgi:hypothetical protein
MHPSVPSIVRRTQALVSAVALVAVLGAAALVAAGPGRAAVANVSVVPTGLVWVKGGAIMVPKLADPEIEQAFTTARVTSGSVELLSAPGKGGVLARLGATSEFGSPRTLSVVERRGRWLGVIAPELGNGAIAWVDSRDSTLRLARTRLSVEIDLSRRQLVVSRGNDILRKVRVGVGAPGSPTPTGRFGLTDKLPGSRYSSSYGCCILALTARQPNLPAGWRGGDRIAVHGTDDPATIGAATSAGCPHASERDLRYLMRRLPLGTPVFIHP